MSFLISRSPNFPLLLFNCQLILMEIENQESPKNPHISLADRWRIVSLKEQGKTATEISKIVQASKSAINDLYQKYLKTGDVIDLPHTGRPQKITEEERKLIKETTNANPCLSLSKIIEESKVNISKTKCWEVLKSGGYECKIAAEKWYVDESHQQKRLAWARKYIKKPEKYWEKVIFTDESLIAHDPNKQRLWVPMGTKVPPTQRDRWQDSILVWGAISSDGKFILEIINGTMNSNTYLNILKKRLLKNFPALRPCMAELKGVEPLVYQHDGSTAHTASVINDYFEERMIEVLEWPAKSPDLNLIESVWSKLKSHLKKSYEDQEELVEDIEKSYNLIPSDYIIKLYSSMKRRIQAVIDSNGLPTKY